jgi:hypothetical protein
MENVTVEELIGLLKAFPAHAQVLIAGRSRPSWTRRLEGILMDFSEGETLRLLITPFPPAATPAEGEAPSRRGRPKKQPNG